MPLASAFASSTSRIPSHSPLTGPPADPFARTPAANWANGAAGIVAPAARAMGGFTAAQVRFAYQTTRKLLIAADLDRPTLLGGRPAAFAGLLTRQQRTQFLAGLNVKGVSKQGNPRSTRGAVISFAPGSTALVGDVIKVHGTMSARPATYHGSAMLDVNVDYVVAYAVEPPHEPTRWMRIVAQDSGPVQFGHWAQASTPFEPWVLFSVFVAGAQCGTTDGYVHPDYPSQTGPRSSVSPSGSPIDPYAMRGADPGTGCEATRGT